MELFSTDRGESVSIEEIMVQNGSRIDGKALRDTDIRRQTSAIIIGIRRSVTGQMIYSPSGDEVVRGGDVLVAIAEIRALNSLADMARA